MSQEIVICWFREDLRVADHPALTKASQQGHLVLPIYIFDDHDRSDQLGAASRLWLHHSLKALDQSLDHHLNLYRGDPLVIIKELMNIYDVKGVFWNRCYTPAAIQRDSAIKQFLESANIEVESFNGSLLWEPWTIKKSDGTHYKVFTPFYRKGCLTGPAVRSPLPKPTTLSLFKDHQKACSLYDLQLLPSLDWGQNTIANWHVGETGAQQALYRFLERGLSNYKEGRNLPSKPFVSRLSPHLHFGEVSPHQLWYAVREHGENDKNVDHFCSELGWREFSYSLLYYYPNMSTQNLQEKFDRFPWVHDKALLDAWKKGMTGIPMVDAGMRELWQTGYMHNRVRMITGSFLVKNLLLDWRHGERWFWDCLFDADWANNSASWQWVAGCGADAAPYFRIFNPVMQGAKFDGQGEYVRHFVPELTDVPDKYLFSPWEAPTDLLASVGVHLGENYPRPIVDLSASRQKALDAFSSLGDKHGF